MSNEKRKRVRAIICFDNKIALMYREFNGRIFYAFPGGGMENNETQEECVVREVFEEFGITVKPIKKVYIYESEKSIEYFYVCEYISGTFASGTGEEFEKDNINNKYVPMQINISDIALLPVMPPEVASAFYEDYLKNDKMLSNETKIIKIRK